MDKTRFHVVSGPIISREPFNTEEIVVESTIKSVDSEVERDKDTPFPAFNRCKTNDSIEITESRDSADTIERSRKAESTVSQWAKHKKTCFGSISHLWAWSIGFVSLITSAVILWAELRKQ